MAYVLVETVLTYRMRYVIDVKDDPVDWSLDTVIMQEAKEFSQKYLDETIVSHRVVSKEEILKMMDEDNDYLKNLSEEEKFKIMVTEYKNV